MGPAHALLVPGQGHHLFIGDGHPERHQAVGQGQVAPPAVLSEPTQLVAELTAFVVDEIHQHVHALRDRPEGRRPRIRAPA